MPDITVTLDDLEPLKGMIADYTETIDQLSGPGALFALETLTEIQAALNQAISLLKSQALELLDGQPMQIGNTVYARQPKLTKRANHSRVKTAIALRAIADTDDILDAAERAVGLTYDLFLSDSSVPKVTVLRKLGLDENTLIGKEMMGWEIKTTKLAADD